ncbi:MAG: DUF4041 domain-containing protein [Clostridiales bacterium]|nr:DUF4041 domain-containing protein [Clostridiales bacterium]
MSIFDLMKVNQYKQKISELEALLRPEHQDIIKLNEQIAELRQTLEDERRTIDIQQAKAQKDLDVFQKLKEKDIARLEGRISLLQNSIISLDHTIAEKKSQVVRLEEEIMIQEFGLYTPLYEAMNSEDLKNMIVACRDTQKSMISKDIACSYSRDWTVNGSKSEGLKMAKNNVKQILRSFNTECESIIDKVKFSNLSAISDRIVKSAEALNKMNVTNRVAINGDYINLKLKELNLVYEYARRKEQEKELERQRREELREQKKLEAEIKRAKEKIQKEQTHFQNAIDELKLKLVTSVDENEKTRLLLKISELEGKLAEVNKQMEDVDYREKNTRAGYVYVISNLGAFGDNVYKIGVTRRLEPLERIKELGDASVPFKFDVHCLIFSEDAPTLETKLHQTFEKYRLNQVNLRREFFRVPLESIEQVIRDNYNDTFDLRRIPDAEEYRISEKVRENIIPAESVIHNNENVEDNDSEV